MTNLTKENFFNEAMEKYPLAMEKFCKWIDEYKVKTNWTELFNQAAGSHLVTPKFHDNNMPIEFQIGVLGFFFTSLYTSEDKIYKNTIESLKREFRILNNRLQHEKDGHNKEA